MIKLDIDKKNFEKLSQKQKQHLFQYAIENAERNWPPLTVESSSAEKKGGANAPQQRNV